jgi:hypothetical protein
MTFLVGAILLDGIGCLPSAVVGLLIGHLSWSYRSHSAHNVLTDVRLRDPVALRVNNFFREEAATGVVSVYRPRTVVLTGGPVYHLQADRKTLII